MTRLDSAPFDISYLESLADLDTPIHRLDPRTKLIATMLFVLAVVSMDKYEISGLMLFFVFPAVNIALASLPLRYVLRRIFMVAPFAVMFGLFNPFLDRDIMIAFGPFGISGGWISFASIMLRFLLTVGSAFILVASTGFFEVCLALEKMKVPRAFVMQLLFLYRYLFILVDEALRMKRARSLRAFDGKGLGVRVAGSLLGHLLLRTLSRARRIHQAMLSRGFNGEIRLAKQLVFTGRDFGYLIIWAAIFLTLRLINVPRELGTLVTG